MKRNFSINLSAFYCNNLEDERKRDICAAIFKKYTVQHLEHVCKKHGIEVETLKGDN